MGLRGVFTISMGLRWKSTIPPFALSSVNKGLEYLLAISNKHSNSSKLFSLWIIPPRRWRGLRPSRGFIHSQAVQLAGFGGEQ